MIPNSTTIDLLWFRRHLLDEILPRWRKASVTASGLFIPHLDRQWRRTGDVTGTIVSQGRLLYNFAVGYRLTGDRAYIDAARRGRRFLSDHFYDAEHKGFFYRCDWDGRVLDDAKDSYGHAFVVFGASHLFGVTGDVLDKSMTALALGALVHLTDDENGMTPRTNREFSARLDEGNPINSQNPMMHSFEALLAFEANVKQSSRVFLEAIADRLFSWAARLRSRSLPELYTEDWQPLPTDQGGRVDIGHQFEWAFLLSRAVELGHSEQYLDWAHELLDCGMRVGYDPAEGGIFANASLEGEVIDRNKGWWQQCEATRALMHFAIVRGRDELWEPLAKTIRYFKANLIDPEYGGWYIGPSLHKGSEWKVDYHVVAMCEEAIRLVEIKGDSS